MELLPEEEDGDPAPIAHLSFFLAWAVRRGLASAEHCTPDAQPLHERTITPWQYVERRVVFRLEDEDFNQTGLDFATAYYCKKGPSQYFRDFCRIFDEAETGSRLGATWANYDRLEPELDEAFAWCQCHGTMEGWEEENT